MVLGPWVAYIRADFRILSTGIPVMSETFSGVYSSIRSLMSAKLVRHRTWRMPLGHLVMMVWRKRG